MFSLATRTDICINKFDLFKESASFVIEKVSSMCVVCICVNNHDLPNEFVEN